MTKSTIDRASAATLPGQGRRAGSPAGQPEPVRTGWLLGLILVAVFMAVLDATIVNVAAPDIRSRLNVSGAGIQLVVAGYTIAYAVLIVTGARLGNRFGHKVAFLTGLTGFTLASLACGLAQNSGELIGFRIVQGTGAALMMPQVLSLLQRHFTGQARVRALSMYTGVIAVGSVLGQVLGGLLLSANLFNQGWRPVFLVNVPIGAVLLLLGSRLLPGDTPARNRKFDIPGTFALAIAVLLLIVPIVMGHQEGWPAWCWASLAASVPMFVIFGLVERSVERRGGTPMVPSAVIRAPRLVNALGAMILGMATYGGYLFAGTVHMQSGLGYSAAHAGLCFAPIAVGFGSVSLFWRRVPMRLWKPAMPTGMLVAALSLLGMMFAQRDGQQIGAASLILLLTAGLGMGVAMSPLFNFTLSGVPLEYAADASGVVATMQQLALAIGLTGFGSIYLTNVSHPYGHSVAQTSGHAIGITLTVLVFGAVASGLVSLGLFRRKLAMAPQTAPAAASAPAVAE
jgi:MFS family permease